MTFNKTVIQKSFTFLVAICFVSVTSFFLFLSQIIAADSTWSQTDWTPDGQYTSATNIDDSVTGQISLSQRSNWLHTDWQYRKKITFDNSPQSENLTNFPVLVKLDTGSDIDYSKTQNAGQDIRFTDSDGTTALPYEIETWNESGSSYVWVKVPQIDGSSNTDHMYMYYNNDGATDAQSSTAVWSDNFSAVIHMNDDPSAAAPQIQDSSPNALQGTTGGTMTSGDQVAGKIGGSLDLDGSNDYIDYGDQPILEIQPPFTLSLWMNLADLPASGQYEVISKYNFAPNREFSWGIGVDSLWAWKSHNGTNGEYFQTGISLDSGDVNQWRHVAMSIDASGAYTLFKDGIAVSSGQIVNSTWYHASAAFNIGRRATNSYYYKGKIDEVTISTINRSDGWMAANFKSHSDTLNSFSSEEGHYNASGTLTSSIYDSSQPSNWGTLTYVSSSTGTVSVKVRTGNASDLSDASDFSSCSAIPSGEDISANSCVTDTDRYAQYQITLGGSGISTPNLESVSITYSQSDIVAPTISTVSSVPATDGGTISWATDEEASSQIEYGLTTSYGTTTAITDTSPRVTDHTVTLSDLRSCTVYHYRVRSADATGNESTGSDNTLTTSGCSGSATIENYTTAPIAAADGGQVTLLENDTGVTLTIPSDFKDEEIIFQVKKLNEDEVLTSISLPVEYQAVEGNVFEFNAFSDVNTVVSSFDKPLTLSFTYTDAQINGLDEATLKLYRWNGIVWQQMSTSINISANTATTEISGFSIYALFGKPGTTSTSSGSNSTSSTTDTSICRDQPPGAKAPWLYGAITQDSNSILLHFTPADNPVNSYVLQYGTKSGEYPYGIQDMGINSREQMTFLVKSLSPNTTYYFRVRGGNGCAPGNWSNEISTKTHGLIARNKISITESEVRSDPPKSCQTHMVVSGDTLWSIADKLLGDGSRFEEIVDGNRNSYPSLQDSPDLKLGWKLKINCGSETQKNQEDSIPESYDVTITVVDTEKKPVKGATVTLHSVPRTTKTDENGIAQFMQVEQGNHRVVIAYNDFEGEQSINLSGGVKEFNLKITVEQKKVMFSGVSLWIISILLVLLLGITTILIRERRQRV